MLAPGLAQKFEPHGVPASLALAGKNYHPQYEARLGIKSQVRTSRGAARTHLARKAYEPSRPLAKLFLFDWRLKTFKRLWNFT